MGMAFSSPFDDFDDLDLDLEGAIETVLLRSFSFDGRDAEGDFRSLSFNGRGSEPHIVTSYGSGRMIFEGSLSFKGRELKTTFSFKRPTLMTENEALARLDSPKSGHENGHFSRSDSACEKKPHSPLPGNHRYSAAVRLQKVYKSFRTRRQLADCAVLVEQKWWKLLDFAELKRSSISFFEIERPESAVSRWSRARMRAAKVGKGLSKDEKARKLALQHWLEAIDPRHRYGHNLQFYYIKWLHCESKQPFFYWLDIGEGKEVNLDRCPRSKLQTQCIKYLGPAERKAYEVVVEDGKFRYKQSGKFIDTREGPVDTKWIFVLSTSKRLYIGQKTKGTFQHSSFLAGGATLSAGRLEIEEGALKAVWPHSGHYLPTEENYQEFMSFLREHNVDLTNVQENPIHQEEIHARKTTVIDLQNHAEADLAAETNGRNVLSALQENKEARQQDADRHKSRLFRLLRSKITKLEQPKDDIRDISKSEVLRPNAHGDSSSEEDYESAEEFWSDDDFSISKFNLFDEEEDKDEEPISKEEIMQRIDSHKGMNSYQLAKQLSSKWSTGAGPRISCMRDYPSELQFRVLEQANLSPRSSRSDCSSRSPFHSPSRFFFSKVHSPLPSTPTSLSKETSFRSPLGTETTRVSSPTTFCRESSCRTTMGAEKRVLS